MGTNDEENINATKEIKDPKELMAVYKRNGSFDRQRKSLLEDFKKSETHNNLLLKLQLIVDSKIKSDPYILMKNKGKMAALIHGGIINDHILQKSGKGSNSLLSIVDKDIEEKIIDSPEFHDILKNELKDIRRRQMGISDEDYAKILEEERKKQEQEIEDSKRRMAERELAYKNNFKIKNLSSLGKISKPPRFNISLSRKNDRHRDTPEAQGEDTHFQSSGNNSEQEKVQSKSISYLKY